MKQILFLIITASCLISCEKYKDNRDDLKGDLYLRGRAFFYNEINSLEILPVGKKEIKISYKGDYDNYLFRTVSDSLGYFLFQNLKENTEYTIWGDYEENGTKFFATFDTSLQVSADSSRLFFTVSDKQNGIIYTVKDAAGGTISNAEVCIFSSFVIANDSCVGSTYPLTTNAFGIAAKFGIAPASYIVFFRAKFGNLLLKGTDTILNLGAREIRRRTVTLR